MRMRFLSNNRLNSMNKKKTQASVYYNKPVNNGYYRNLRMDITNLNKAKSSCGSCGGK